MRITTRLLAALATLAAAGVALAEERTYTFHDATLAYTIERAAPDTGETPIVLVHGWASSRTFWHKQMDEFAATRTTLAVDLPGYGDSEDVADEHTMDLYADAIAGAMDDAGIEKAVIVGHSNGVPTVRQFYRNYPGRVVALVGVDGAFEDMMPPGMLEQIIPNLEGENYKQFVMQMFGGMQDALAHEGDLELVRDTMLGTPQRVMVGGFRAANDPSIWKDDRIGVPLLVINARNPFWTDEYVERLKSLSENTEVHTWEGVSHFLFMDEPEKFNEAVLTFLDEHDC